MSVFLFSSVVALAQTNSSGPALAFKTFNIPPVSFYQQGRLTGFAVEVIRELQRRLKRNDSFAMLPLAEVLGTTVLDSDAAIFPLSRTRDRERRFKWVGPLLSEPVSLYARSSSTIDLADMGGARHVRAIATLRNSSAERYLIERGFTNVIGYSSAALGADALNQGRVDLWLTSDLTMASQARHSDVNPRQLRKVLEVTSEPMYLAFSRNTADAVIDAWQGALERLRTDGTFDRLRAAWQPSFALGVGGGETLEPELRLTSQEQAFVAEAPTIRIGVDPDYKPVEWVKDGIHYGMTAEYLELVAHRTGLTFQLVPSLNWTQVLEQLRVKELDLVCALVETPERRRYTLFTKSYLSFPSVVVVRDDAPFLSGLEDIAGRTVAVVKDYYTNDLLRNDYPDLVLFPAPSLHTALEAVSLGQAFAYVGDLATASHSIRELGLTNLKVVARTEYGSDEMRMGVRTDLPLLRDIMDKALASITREEHRTIYSKWITSSVESKNQLDALWKWVGWGALAVAVLLGLVVFWNRRLQREIEERRRSEELLRESEHRFRTLFESANIGIFVSEHNTGQLISANQRMADILGYEDPEALYRAGPAAYPDERELQASIRELDAKGSFAGRVISFQRPDRSWIYVEYSASLDLQTDRIYGVVQDVTRHKEAEDGLKATSNMMRALIDAIPFYVAHLDLGRRFKVINRMGASLIGLSPDKIEGRHVSEVVPPAVWGLVKSFEDRALAGEVVHADLQTDFVREGGQYRVYYSPHLDAYGAVHGLVSCIQDVTEQRQAEEHLRSSEQRYRTVVERSNDAILIVNDQGQILYVNPRTETMFGYSEDELRRLDSIRLFPDTIVGENPLWQARGKNVAYEAQMVTKEGEILEVENSTALIVFEGQWVALTIIRDRTVRRRALEMLKRNEERLQTALDSTDFGLWEYLVPQDAMELPEKLFCERYGYRPDELANNRDGLRELLHPEDRELAQEFFIEFIHKGAQEGSFESRVKAADGSWRWLVVHGRVMEHDDGKKPVRLLGLMQDITERKQTEDMLRDIATTDSLTGLHNRRSFLEISERELDRSRRYNTPVSLCMLDADHFKAINDNYGHDVGDDVLRSLAKAGLAGIRNVDVFGRMGGEEFAVLLPETGMAQALEAAERLRVSIGDARVPLPSGDEVGCTVSIGVAQATEDDTLTTLLKRADKALYRAKDLGRNRIEPG